METPKTGNGVRRHARTTIRRRPSVLRSRLPMKSNPYIGWFRHAPPSLGPRRRHTLGHKKYKLCSKDKQLYAPSALHMKNSPYIGWFRHAPPSRLCGLDKKKCHALLEQEFSRFFESLPMKLDSSCCHRTKFVSGRLPGGSPCEDDATHVFPPLTWLDSNVSESLRRSLHESSIVSGSATVKVLTRLAFWFLFPLAHDATEYTSCNDDYCEDDMLPHILPKALQGILEDEEDSYYPRETEMDSDNVTAVSEISEDEGLGASISSLAEAYHAHQRAEASRQNELLLYEGHHRLDYVVTQMDIARMAKNASRHLDVESILNLPTVTYRSESPPVPPSHAVPEHERTEEEGWSWMIVPPDPESQEKPPPNKDGDDQNVCVICLEHFVDGDRLRVLPCDHLFHMGCIDRWLSGTYSDEDCVTSGCPTCKKRPELQEPPSPDGSVPSWAFSRVGDALARDSLDLANA